MTDNPTVPPQQSPPASPPSTPPAQNAVPDNTLDKALADLEKEVQQLAGSDPTPTHTESANTKTVTPTPAPPTSSPIPKAPVVEAINEHPVAPPTTSSAAPRMDAMSIPPQPSKTSPAIQAAQGKVPVEKVAGLSMAGDNTKGTPPPITVTPPADGKPPAAPLSGKKKGLGGKLIAGIGMMVLIAGLGVSIFLVKQSQDLRQQASTDGCGEGSSVCTPAGLHTFCDGNIVKERNCGENSCWIPGSEREVEQCDPNENCVQNGITASCVEVSPPGTGGNCPDGSGDVAWCISYICPNGDTAGKNGSGPDGQCTLEDAGAYEGACNNGSGCALNQNSCGQVDFFKSGSCQNRDFSPESFCGFRDLRLTDCQPPPPSNVIPDCTNLSLANAADPSKLQVGTQYTFNVTAVGAPPITIDRVGIHVHTPNSCNTVFEQAPDTPGPGTYQRTWTPTAPGTYVVSARVWNDGIAEGRADCVDGPPRFLFPSANGNDVSNVCKMTVTVSSPTASPSPSPTASPSPSPTASPSPSPTIPICAGVTLNTSTPKMGDQVTFTCSLATGATKYEFRYAINSDTAFTPLAPSSTVNLSSPLTITQYGTYIAQCRPCNATQCAAWESVGSVNGTK